MTEKLNSERLRTLIDVGGFIVSELDLDTLLRRVLDAALELTGARYAALGVLNAERSELERFMTAGIDEDAQRRIGELPHGRGVLGVLIDDPKPLRLKRVGGHPASYGFPMGHPPMESFLGVPVFISGEAWGNLYLTEKEGGEFDEADEEAIVVLARWAGIAVENARLYHDIENQRVELERAVAGLRATQAVALAVGAEVDLERSLELIVKRGVPSSSCFCRATSWSSLRWPVTAPVAATCGSPLTDPPLARSCSAVAPSASTRSPRGCSSARISWASPMRTAH